MNGIKCCRDCNDRCIGCHSYCELYISERAELDAIKERERQCKEIVHCIKRSNFHRRNTRFRKKQGIKY